MGALEIILKEDVVSRPWLLSAFPSLLPAGAKVEAGKHRHHGPAAAHGREAVTQDPFEIFLLRRVVPACGVDAGLVRESHLHHSDVESDGLTMRGPSTEDRVGNQLTRTNRGASGMVPTEVVEELLARPRSGASGHSVASVRVEYQKLNPLLVCVACHGIFAEHVVPHAVYQERFVFMKLKLVAVVQPEVVEHVVPREPQVRGNSHVHIPATTVSCLLYT